MATGVLGITPERRGLAQDSRKGIPQSSARDQARGSAAMNRVWDYIGFAFWFAGLGFILLRLLLRACPRRRHAAACAIPARKPAAVLRPRRRKSECTLRPVKPRSHFGLRGIPE